MKWISVEDEKPKDGDYSILIAYDNGSVEMGQAIWVIEMVHVQDEYDRKWPTATHWMPMPDPPKDNQ